MEVTNNQEVKSKRDSMLERLKGKYPDKEFADDEAVYGQISDDYDDYDNQLSNYRDHEEKLTNMFNADPRSAQFLSNWSHGENPAVALVRMYGEDIKEAMDDPERLETIAQANKEYVDRVAKNKELEEQYQQNLPQRKKFPCLKKCLQNLPSRQRTTSSCKASRKRKTGTPGGTPPV